MEIVYSPSVKDLKAFQSYWTRHHNASVKGGRTTGFIIVAAVIVLLLFGVYLITPIAGLPGVMWNLGVMIAVLVLIVIAFLVFHWRQLARALPGEVRVSTQNDGLHHTDVGTRSVTRWDKIEHVGATEDHIMVIFAHYRGIAIPRSALDGQGAAEAFLADLRQRLPETPREVPNLKEPGTAKRGRRRVWAAVGLTLVLAFAVWFAKPWRETAALPGDMGEIEYLVRETGGAGADDRLPLIVDIHPLGGLPEVFAANSHQRDFPARIVYPAGPQWFPVGNSWYSLDWNEAQGEIRVEAERLTAFLAVLTDRYPTTGRPIVTGFSQGGTMSAAIAGLHPQAIAAAVALGGGLSEDLPAYDAPPPVTVRYLMGEEDDLHWAEYSLEQMRGQDWDVELIPYPETGHEITDTMRDDWHRLLAELAAREAAR